VQSEGCLNLVKNASHQVLTAKDVKIGRTGSLKMAENGRACKGRKRLIFRVQEVNRAHGSGKRGTALLVLIQKMPITDYF